MNRTGIERRKERGERRNGYAWLFLPLLFSFALFSVTIAAQVSFRMIQYNVENLFDTVRSAVHNDADFTPEGKNHWTAGRYWIKLGNMARVIAAVGGTTPVDLVGMVEVENETVLNDLTKHTSLRSLGYEYCITQGKDERGINVALLYQPAKFKLLSAENLPVVVPEGMRPTRDVLKVEGMLPTRDTLTVFVVHFPSRRGGVGLSERYRSHVATVVREHIDSIFVERPLAKVVVMGDMNADMQSPCMAQGLKAKVLKSETVLAEGALYEAQPATAFYEEVKGTYFFQNEWEQIDHILVSPSVVQSRTMKVSPEGWSIFDASFLLDEKRKSARKWNYPKRTYLGTNYQKGFSDHLPVVLQMQLFFE